MSRLRRPPAASSKPNAAPKSDEAKDQSNPRGPCNALRVGPGPLRLTEARSGPAPYTHFQSRRDCVPQPRVASLRTTLGNRANRLSTPTELWPRTLPLGATPLGLARPGAVDPG